MVFLNLPGIGGSGPKHWQALWEQKDRRFKRVEQRDWDNPDCGEWVRQLQQAVDACGPESILVAHSLGCLQAAHWAAKTQSKISAALLVAPADPENICFPPQATGFNRVPLKPLPFRTILVASTDDPFCDLAVVRRYAQAWQSRFVEAGAIGHINAESNIGDWPFGFALLKELDQK